MFKLLSLKNKLWGVKGVNIHEVGFFVNFLITKILSRKCLNLEVHCIKTDEDSISSIFPSGGLRVWYTEVIYYI